MLGDGDDDDDGDGDGDSDCDDSGNRDDNERGGGADSLLQSRLHSQLTPVFFST